MTCKFQQHHSVILFKSVLYHLELFWNHQSVKAESNALYKQTNNILLTGTVVRSDFIKKKIKLNVFGAISFAESMLIDSSLIVIFII